MRADPARGDLPPATAGGAGAAFEVAVSTARVLRDDGRATAACQHARDVATEPGRPRDAAVTASA